MDFVYSGEWFCSFCRDLLNPEMEYDCNRQDSPPSEKFPLVERRKCERLLLRLFCNDLSTDFQQPAAPSETRRYKELVKTPMDLSVIKKKLELQDDGGYVNPEELVADVRLIFFNCAKYYKPTSEIGCAGLYLEDYFEEQLKIIFPERLFPGGREEQMIPPLEDEIDDDEEPVREDTAGSSEDKPPSPERTETPPAEEEESTASTERKKSEEEKSEEEKSEKSDDEKDRAAADGEEGGVPADKMKQEEATVEKQVENCQTAATETDREASGFLKEETPQLPIDKPPETQENSASTVETVEGKD